MPTASRESSPSLFAALVHEVPFLRLTWHFVQSILRGGQEAGDVDASLGGLVGLLSLPGVFVTLSLLDRYSSLKRYFLGQAARDNYDFSVPDKYFFIVFSMAITGLVTVWKWDRILPNRQDYVNLAPLPLKARRIFFANLLAVLGVVVTFAVVVNLGSTLLFPMIVTAETGSLREALVFMAVHATVVAAASAFTFFACLLVLGALLSVLPPAWFLRASLPVRMMMVAVCVALLGTSFSAPSLLRHPPEWLGWLPPIWFLSWYQSMQGRATLAMAGWARLALPATGFVFVFAMGAYLLSYQRSFVRIPEAAGVARRGTSEHWPWLRGLLERLVFRTPFERAIGIFMLRALARSEAHLILTAGFLAMGLVSAAQAATAALQAEPGILAPSSGWLAIPLILAYFMVCGVRLAVDVPATIEANWVFRSVLAPGEQATAAVIRKVVLVSIALFVCLPALVLLSWRWNLFSGCLHALYVLLLAALLLEFLLLGHRKIPVTCSLPPFERQAPLMFLFFCGGFALFCWGGASAQRAMLLYPARFVWLAAFTGAAVYGLREWKREIPDVDRELLFHDAGTRVFEQLELNA